MDTSKHRLLQIAWAVAAAAGLGASGCNLVLGIDEVSAAHAPDGGSRTQGVSRERGDDAESLDASGGSDPLPEPATGDASAPGREPSDDDGGTLSETR